MMEPGNALRRSIGPVLLLLAAMILAACSGPRPVATPEEQAPGGALRIAVYESPT